jgi:hypothetical protein
MEESMVQRPERRFNPSNNVNGAANPRVKTEAVTSTGQPTKCLQALVATEAWLLEREDTKQPTQWLQALVATEAWLLEREEHQTTNPMPKDLGCYGGLAAREGRAPNNQPNTYEF